MKPGLCPDFPVMVGDWLSSTAVAMMTPAEEGAYFHLLCHAWSDSGCCLPDNEEALAALSRLGPQWHQGSGAKIRRNFVADAERPGFIFNERQRATRQAQADRVEAARQKCSVMREAKRAKRQSSYKEPLKESYKEPLQALSSPLSPLPSPKGKAEAPKPMTPSERISLDREIEAKGRDLKELEQDTSEEWQLGLYPKKIAEKRKLKAEIAELRKQREAAI